MLTILVRQHQLCFELLISCSYVRCSEYECWGTLIDLRESHCTHLMNSTCVKGGYPLFFIWVFLWLKTSVHARNHRWWPLVMSSLGQFAAIAHLWSKRLGHAPFHPPHTGWIFRPFLLCVTYTSFRGTLNSARYSKDIVFLKSEHGLSEFLVE